MQSTENDDKATPANATLLDLDALLADLSSARRHAVSVHLHGTALLLGDAETALAAERDRADRAETALVEAWDRGADYGVASTHPTLRDNPYRSKATA